MNWDAMAYHVSFLPVHVALWGCIWCAWELAAIGKRAGVPYKEFPYLVGLGVICTSAQVALAILDGIGLL